jgi:nitrite reductase (NADH) large subunit
MASVALQPVQTPRLWRAAQFIGLLLTVALLAALVRWPKLSLHVLWDMVIPLLPATFLVNPLLWRNVCPLATLNEWTGKRVGQRSMSPPLLRVAWLVGLLLLAILVPARRFLFNTNGPALAGVVIVVALLALGAGFAFSGRSGFCNAICPVLSVEKLYGQAPLAELGNARCASCTVCVPIGCIDLAFRKTVAQTIGPARRDPSWVATPFGAFACAFPGFIVGYFTTVNGPLSTAGQIYWHMAIASLVSYLVFGGIVLIARPAARVMLPTLGCLAIALYYWYAAPSLGAAYGAPAVGPAIVRLLALALIIYWIWHATAQRGSAEGRLARIRLAGGA